MKNQKKLVLAVAAVFAVIAIGISVGLRLSSDQRAGSELERVLSEEQSKEKAQRMMNDTADSLRSWREN
jgi:hypothetical protein